MKINHNYSQYKKICNSFITMFCIKQDLSFDQWVDGEIGSLAAFFNEYYFTLNDIVYDLTTYQNKGLILKWQNDYLEHNNNEFNNKYINYKSYTNGFRFKDLIY